MTLERMTSVTALRRGRATAAPPEHVAHFELLRLLGRGGMGEVYEARDVALERRVALKLVRRDRAAREARALARLVDPNVVRVFEAGATADRAYIAMELIDGPTLHAWLHEPRDWRAIVDVFAGVGRGLARVHALGLVHRDVKPANIFLDRDGTPKLGDFGLAIAAGAIDAEDVVGTPAYMAPEQRDGHRLDARVDQFAFCAMLYEALTGALPSPTDGAYLRIPRPLRPIVARGLAEAPAARWPSMTALVRALESARRGPLDGLAAVLERLARRIAR